VLDVGWSCPRCEVVLAPSVSEHRCAPPSAGVTTAVPHPPPYQPPTSISTTLPDTWTVTVQGSTADPALITEALQRDYLRARTVNWQPRVIGGSAA
jgi:hypothetical protein